MGVPESTIGQGSVLHGLVEQLLGAPSTDRLFHVLAVPPALLSAVPGSAVPGSAGQDSSGAVSQPVLAQALNMLLFADLLERVPAADAYVRRALASGRTVFHDHGAVRTVAAAPGNGGSHWGALPAGEEAIARLLRPLGYVRREVYPLPKLKMTGRSYAQAAMPEQIAQFFLSELHPEQFSPTFQSAVARVLGESVDPLTPEARELLAQLERDRSLPAPAALQLLPVLLRCFGRQHPEPAEADYELLLAESAEMAWIATEGNAFNHVTDRVDDVEALSDELKALGEPIKETVERSGDGRVRQTALRAARVRRRFRTPDGSTVEREVPGSFLEFITRLPVEQDGPLDLSFNSGNAQAIFKMTAGS